MEEPRGVKRALAQKAEAESLDEEVRGGRTGLGSRFN